jgi:glycosyltransferase involved in cell wall biosynthesis
MQIPVVHTLRDFYLLCARSTMFKHGSQCAAPCLECRLITFRRRVLAEVVDGFIAISNRLLEIHRVNGLEVALKRAIVIPNAVDVPGHSEVNVPTQVDKTNFVIGFLGRVVATKGIEQLIRAFARANIPNSILRIAGEGPPEYVKSLKKLAADRKVEFVGKQNPVEFLLSTSIVAIPSLWEEPFGRVIAEALVMGVPVICSDRGSFPELLARFPGGLLTSPEDEQQFAEDLVTMRAEAPRLKAWLMENKVALAKFFSSDRIADQYTHFYQEFLRKPEAVLP